MRFQPKLWPTLIALPALLVLIALGLWQLQRAEWKSELIAEIASHMAAAPVAVETLFQLPADEIAWRRVTARGRFADDREIHIFTHREGGEAGYRIVAPFELAGGGIVLVDRGFVPERLKEPSSREPAASGQIVLDAVLRPSGEAGAFTPPDEIAANRWFSRDLAAMAASLNLTPALGLFVAAENPPDGAEWPQPVALTPDIPNDHLQYAITWFGLALGLLAIYLLYHYREGRLGSPPEH